MHASGACTCTHPQTRLSNSSICKGVQTACPQQCSPKAGERPDQCSVIGADLIEQIWFCPSYCQKYYPNNSCWRPNTGPRVRSMNRGLKLRLSSTHEQFSSPAEPRLPQGPHPSWYRCLRQWYAVVPEYRVGAFYRAQPKVGNPGCTASKPHLQLSACGWVRVG